MTRLPINIFQYNMSEFYYYNWERSSLVTSDPPAQAKVRNNRDQFRFTK